MEAPTEKQFRDCGYTADAINFPLSEGAFRAKCKFNGAIPEKVGAAWRYAPNAWCQNYWEQKALQSKEAS